MTELSRINQMNFDLGGFDAPYFHANTQKIQIRLISPSEFFYFALFIPIFICLAVLKLNVDFVTMLIGRKARDSCGSTVQGRPRRRKAPRRLPGPPAESEAPGAEINSQV